MVRSSFVAQDLAQKNGIVLNFESSSVANAGDLNGDGLTDIIVGSPFRSVNGITYVVFNNGTGFPDNLDLNSFNGNNGFIINGLGRNDRFGISVDGGDFNNDGINDILVGANSANGIQNTGASYVIFGKTDAFNSDFDLATLDGSNGFAIAGLRENDQLGSSVSAIGDINGDGLEDFALGAPGRFFSETNAGQVYVVFGNSTGFDANVDLASLDGSNGFVIDGVASGGRLGNSVSSAGDFNNDGIDDLVIGAPEVDRNKGQAYVVYGKTEFDSELKLANLTQAEGFTVTGTENFDEIGSSVSEVGDINNDGIADIVVAGSNEAYVIFGQTSNIANVNPNSLDGNNGFAFTTQRISSFDELSVSSAGDFNGDGIEDLIIGNRQAKPYGQYSAGSVYVVFGQDGDFAANITPDDLDGSNGFILNNLEEFDDLGEGVSSAGDVNGDGFADLLITSDNDNTFVIFGSANPGDNDNIAPRIDLDRTTPGRNFTASFVSRPVIIVNPNELIVADDDNSTLVGATIKITNAVDGASESLSIDTTGTNITANYDPQTATLTLTGNDLIFSGYQKVLQTLTYNNTAAIPETSDRTIEITLDDGESINNLSPVATATVEFNRDSAIVANSVIDTATFDTSNTLVFNSTFRSISDAGDVNGDGFDDIIIGLPSAGRDTSNYYNTLRSGQSYIVFGQDSNFDANLNSDRLDGNNGFIVEGGDAAFIGRAVSSAEDINGDGFADVVIGGDFDTGISGYSSTAYRFATVGGQAYIIFGSDRNQALVQTDDLDGSNGFTVTSGSSPRDIGDLGESVSNAGDINGDGFADIILGGTSEPSLALGRLYSEGAGLVVFGKAAGFESQINIPVNDSSNGFVIAESFTYSYSGANNASLGDAVTGGGDINGDGFADVIIGAPRAGDYYSGFKGEAYVIFGKSNSFSEVTRVTNLNGSNGFVITNQTDDSLGDSVSIAGDVNGDGLDDIIVGAPGAEVDDVQGVGKVHVIFGQTADFDAEFNPAVDADFTIEGVIPSDNLGTSVEDLGDIKNDGFADFIINNSYIIFGGNNLQGNLKISEIDGTNGFIIDNNSLATGGGDINNDGIADILVATNNDDNPQTFVLFGNSAPNLDFNGNASGNNNNVSFDNNAITISENLTLQDANNRTLQGAAITISNVQDGIAETLTVNVGNTNINANYNPTNGTLILTGEDTIANYQQILQTVSYNNTANNPTETNRIIEFVVSDGEAFSNISNLVTTTITFGDIVTPPPSGTQGTAGNDIIKGKAIADLIKGLAGNDSIQGLGGNDNLFGDNGKDLIKGNRGNDTLFGGRGDDTLQGNKGNDLVQGNSGKDNLFGDSGHDVLVGGVGDDVLKGGSGSDRLDGGQGNDLIFGGKGADKFVLRAGDGTDRIVDYRDGLDKFVLTGGLDFSDIRTVQNINNTQLQVIATGEVLANLNSVTANFLDQDDFVLEV